MEKAKDNCGLPRSSSVMNCDELLDAANLHVSFASYVGCYIGKWNPYGLHDVMRLYFDKFPNCVASASIDAC